MGRFTSFRSKVREVVAAKLGRCTDCMVSSGRGAVVAWLAAAVLYIAWPQPLVLGGILILASAFTLLMASHIVSYTARLRRRQTVEAREAGISRRRFVRSALEVGASVVLLTLFGFSNTALARTKCNGKHNKHNQPKDFPRSVDGRGRTKDAARDEMLTGAANKCQDYCAPKTCVPAGHNCRSSRAPTLNDIANINCHLDNPNDPTSWHCVGDLTSCSCHCE